MSEGVWRTVSGRRVFIRDGQSLTDAMKESGKFMATPDRTIGHVDEDELYEALPDDKADQYMGQLRDYTDDYNWVLENQERADKLSEAIDSAENAHWNDGELYRGLAVDDDFADALQEGDVIETGMPSSWTSDGSVAAEFASGGHIDGAGQRMVVLVDKTEGSRNAISLQDLSRHQDENEVLYSGNSAFKILDRREEESFSGDTILYVDVVEVRR